MIVMATMAVTERMEASSKPQNDLPPTAYPLDCRS
jgi:hypothetical protein